MDQIYLDALRDIAIEHIARAQQDRTQAIQYGQSRNTFHLSLAHTALSTLSKGGTTAVEYAAACLLNSVIVLSIEPDKKITEKQHNAMVFRVIESAKELCTLTGKDIQWLDSTSEDLSEPETSIEVPTPHPAIKPPVNLSPGTILTTEEAARFLKRKPQTLRSWASKENGPLSPIRNGRSLAWPSNEIIRLMNEGWQ